MAVLMKNLLLFPSLSRATSTTLIFVFASLLIPVYTLMTPLFVLYFEPANHAQINSSDQPPSPTWPQVPRLGALMLSLDAAQLSTLCRLLALMLYHPQGEGEYPLHLDPNPPSTSYGSSLANSEAEPPRPGAGGAADEAMADLNQKVLLELPGALQRLLALLKVHALLITNPAPTVRGI